MIQMIRNYLRAVPFQAFEIRCSNGDAFRVEHPENAAVVKSTVVVALPDGENVISLTPLHIVGVSGVDALAA